MAAVAVCAAVTAVTVWTPASAQSAHSAPAAPDGAGVARQVTLPTGEKVLLDERGRVAGVIGDAGAGGGLAEGQGWSVDGYDSITRDGGTQVIPHAARAGIEEGTLDPGLFNVTEPGHDLSPPTERDVAAETANVALAATDRAGEATPFWDATIVDLETFERIYVAPTDPNDPTVELELPVGEYAVYTSVDYRDNGEATGYDWLLMPHVSVTEDTVLDFPAAAAEEMDLTFEDEPAASTQMSLGFDMPLVGTDRGFSSVWTVAGRPPDGIGTAQLGEPSDEFALSGSVYKWVSDGDREFHTADSRTDGFYTGLTQHTDSQDLARITAEAGMTMEDSWGIVVTTPSVPYLVGIASERLPISRDVYVRADAALWSHDFSQYGSGFESAYTAGDTRAYRPGEEYRETFNTGVFGPVMSTADDGLFRLGNTLYGAVNLLADGAGHRSYDPWGYGEDPLYEGAVTTLYRNGEEYATAEGPVEEVEFELPAEEAEYRLVTTIERDSAVFSVSTEVVAEYTFTSAAGPEDGPVSVPSYAVRYSPELALDNTAPAGETVEVPVTVQGSAAGADPASLDVSVAVSFDGGGTWTDAPVRDGRICVDNPAAGGSVSFRAEVADRDGTTVTQTVIDAYRTR